MCLHHTQSLNWTKSSFQNHQYNCLNGPVVWVPWICALSFYAISTISDKWITTKATTIDVQYPQPHEHSHVIMTNHLSLKYSLNIEWSSSAVFLLQLIELVVPVWCWYNGSLKKNTSSGVHERFSQLQLLSSRHSVAVTAELNLPHLIFLLVSQLISLVFSVRKYPRVKASC